MSSDIPSFLLAEKEKEPQCPTDLFPVPKTGEYIDEAGQWPTADFVDDIEPMIVVGRIDLLDFINVGPSNS